MFFPCIESCPRKDFTSRRSLGAHQVRCEYVREQDNRLSDVSEASEDVERASKRQRTNLGHQDEENFTSHELSDSSTSFLADSPAPGPSLAPAPPRAHLLTRSQARLLRTGFRLEHDTLPEPPPPLDPPIQDSAPLDPQSRDASTATRNASTLMSNPLARHRSRLQPFRTEPDIFGRYRVYSSRPQTIPDSATPSNSSAVLVQRSDPPRSIQSIIAPCPNISTFYVQRHHWLDGGTKSLNSRESLCQDVLLQPDFNPRDLAGVNFRALDSKLAEAALNWDPACPPSEGWRNISLRLEIPPPRQTAAELKRTGGPPPKSFINVEGLRARKLLDIMIRVCSKNNTSTFHYETFESYWKPPASPSAIPQQLTDEMYTTPAMRRLHQEVQVIKISDTSCTLPRCVAAYMFFSDGTQLGSFGSAKAWPLYCQFGNESKYERCKPNSGASFQIAHIPSLPDCVKDDITKLHNGKPPNDALLTHLRRELMHEVWASLIDDEFVYAWKNGVVIKCADGITRCVFPRILTYSADYPEKVLLGTIRNGGDCPCPRCLVRKNSASKMGTPGDMRLRVVKRRVDSEKRRGLVRKSRKYIYELGRTVQSKPIEALLQSESYVPTMNAFSRKLGIFKFNIFSALVVDQLHEVELGVWKALCKHLVRVLHLSGHAAVGEFDRRFRSVPTFGSTIRLFASDVSSLSRLAARDFEDILQCCGPVFQGLLPEICDAPVQRIIFIFAQWHGLAKLRLHTSTTIKVMKKLTSTLGNELRAFAELTQKLDVRETPKEYASRRKRYEAAVTKSTSVGRKRSSRSAAKKPDDGAGDGRRKCALNLDTYKMHALGDYTRTIEEFGSTDSYSTQIGELLHRTVKAQYARTNKRDAVPQMTHIGDVSDVLKRMDDEIERAYVEMNSANAHVDETDHESILNGEPYAIGQKDRSEDMIASVAGWVDSQRQDDAMKFFIPQLKRHLLIRILGSDTHADFNEPELGRLQFHRGRIYQHHTLRINYTSYDVLRQQDVLNPSTPRCFALLPADTEQDESTHPYLYAKVLGVYHAQVVYRGRLPRRMDFVHVRWLFYDQKQPGGWDVCRLDRLSYGECQSDEDVLNSFSFVDPSDIVRAAHLIPDFSSGISNTLLRHPVSVAHDGAHGDWMGYYANRFVDRDMLMRYLGGGVGHLQLNQISTSIAVDNETENTVTPEENQDEEATVASLTQPP